MNLKKLVLAGGGSFLAMFVLSYAWHVLLMSSLYMPGEKLQVWVKNKNAMVAKCDNAGPEQIDNI